ncbi:MAG: SPOR domain-containing protein [Rhodoferax sp.]|nr:SPOR domain-containing protein [Rhodoferax sp.]
MPSPAATALDTTDEHSTTALYRAAIGTVNPDYYLPLFTRFETAGRGGLSWNWAAALYTLNWLAFRRLWHAALVYGGMVVMLALGVLGIGRLVYQFSDTTQWALMGGLLALAILLPGVGGNAVLFAATRQRLQAALKATATVAEACALLERQAPSRRGLIIQMVTNALALGVAAYSWNQFIGMEPLPTGLPKVDSTSADARNVAVGRTTDPTDGASAPAAQPAASAPMSIASAPMATPTAAPAQPTASAALPAASDSGTPPTATLPPLARTAASAPVAAQTVVSPTPAATPAKRAVPIPAAAAIPKTPEPTAQRRTAQRVAPQAPTVPLGNEPQALRYVLNVGTFTDENEALNAFVRLTDARLPATRQTFVDRKGPRVVVRVGPYDTSAEAEAGADTVRTLGLKAQLQPLPPQ